MYILISTGRSVFDARQRQRIFPLASVSRPALRPIQPPVQWVYSRGLKGGRGVTLTTQLHLVPRSRMRTIHAAVLLVACLAVGRQLYFIVESTDTVVH
jgi:hypothetical protein